MAHKALLGLAKAPELEAALQELLLPPPEVPGPREPATHAAQTAAAEAEGEPAEGTTGGANGRGMLRRLLPRGLQVSPVPAGLEDVCSSSKKRRRIGHRDQAGRAHVHGQSFVQKARAHGGEARRTAASEVDVR